MNSSNLSSIFFSRRAVSDKVALISSNKKSPCNLIILGLFETTGIEETEASCEQTIALICKFASSKDCSISWSKFVVNIVLK